MDPEFKAMIDTLIESPNSRERAAAAKKLGEHVDELDDEEYERAKEAINRALTDPDPSVLMAAMDAMSKFSRKISGEDFEIYGDAQEDIAPEKVVMCRVCGRPEMLVPDGGCEIDGCPYA